MCYASSLPGSDATDADGGYDDVAAEHANADDTAADFQAVQPPDCVLLDRPEPQTCELLKP